MYILPEITSIETAQVARSVCRDWRRAFLPCVEATDAGPDQAPHPNDIYGLTYRIARDLPSPFYSSLPGSLECHAYPSPDTVLGNLARLYTTMHVLCQSTTIGIFRILYSEDDSPMNALAIKSALLINKSVHTVSLVFYYQKLHWDAIPFPLKGIPSIAGLWEAIQCKKTIRNVSIHGQSKFCDSCWNDNDNLQPYEDWLYFSILVDCFPLLDKFECNLWSDESVALMLDAISKGSGPRYLELRNISVSADEFCQCLLSLLRVKPEPEMSILIDCQGFAYAEVENEEAVFRELLQALEVEYFQRVHVTFWNIFLTSHVEAALRKFPCFTVVTDFTKHQSVPFL
jgi:hypothetical protein